MLPDLYEDKNGVRENDTQKFTARHALVCDMHIAGMNNLEIASALSYTPNTVSIILGDVRAKDYIREQRDRIAASTPDIYKKMELYAHEAVEELVREMRFGTKEDRVKQSASTAILDRLGYSPIRKELRASTNAPLSDESVGEMEKLLDQSKEIRARFSFGESPPEKKDDEAA